MRRRSVKLEYAATNTNRRPGKEINDVKTRLQDEDHGRLDQLRLVDSIQYSRWTMHKSNTLRHSSLLSMLCKGTGEFITRSRSVGECPERPVTISLVYAGRLSVTESCFYEPCAWVWRPDKKVVLLARSRLLSIIGFPDWTIPSLHFTPLWHRHRGCVFSFLPDWAGGSKELAVLKAIFWI